MPLFTNKRIEVPFRPHMKQLLCGLTVLAALASPAGAATCAEGVQVVEQMSKALDLPEAERSNIQALIAKAKIEDRQGHQRNCKIILAGAIRFFLIKTVLD
ncbi:MAG: hypothetical protein WBQ49_12275 [Rhodomicrobium sp.]